jgi:hypothetical protein
MIQRCQHTGLAFESRDALRILSERYRDQFDGDIAAQLCIRRLIYLSHAAGSKVTCNPVMCERRSNHERAGRIYGRILSDVGVIAGEAFLPAILPGESLSLQEEITYWQIRAITPGQGPITRIARYIIAASGEGCAKYARFYESAEAASHII